MIYQTVTLSTDNNGSDHNRVYNPSTSSHPKLRHCKLTIVHNLRYMGNNTNTIKDIRENDVSGNNKHALIIDKI